MRTIFACVYVENNLQFQSNFGTNHRWMKRIKDCSKDGPGSFPRRDNLRNSKIGLDLIIILKSSLEPLSYKRSYLHKNFLI
jgi:hypothetical protein